jgi:hypothetical protein
MLVLTATLASPRVISRNDAKSIDIVPESCWLVPESRLQAALATSSPAEASNPILNLDFETALGHQQE